MFVYKGPSKSSLLWATLVKTIAPKQDTPRRGFKTLWKGLEMDFDLESEDEFQDEDFEANVEDERQQVMMLGGESHEEDHREENPDREERDYEGGAWDEVDAMAMLQRLKFACKRHKGGPLSDHALRQVLQPSASVPKLAWPTSSPCTVKTASSMEPKSQIRNSSVSNDFKEHEKQIQSNSCGMASSQCSSRSQSFQKNEETVSQANKYSVVNETKEDKEDLEFFMRVAKEHLKQRKTKVADPVRKVSLPPVRSPRQPCTPNEREEDEFSATARKENPILRKKNRPPEEWGTVKCLSLDEDDLVQESEFGLDSTSSSIIQANAKASRPTQRTKRAPRLSYSSSLLVRSRRRENSRPFQS